MGTCVSKRSGDYMKNEGAIRHQLKQVLFRHQKKRLGKALRRLPSNCAFNKRPYFLPDAETGLCICLHEERAGMICDDKVNPEVPKECPYFDSIRTKDEVKEEFQEFLQQPKSVIASEMPDAAALMWVLDNEGGMSSEDAETITGADFNTPQDAVEFAGECAACGNIPGPTPPPQGEDEWVVPEGWWARFKKWVGGLFGGGGE